MPGSAKEIVFTLNTTHAINTVALGFKFRPGDVVLLTDREHNSNLMPWLKLQKTGVIKVDYLAADPDEAFDLGAFERTVEKRPGPPGQHGLYIERHRLHDSRRRNHQDRPSLRRPGAARRRPDGAASGRRRSGPGCRFPRFFAAQDVRAAGGGRALRQNGNSWDRGPQEEERRGDVIEPAILGGGTAVDTTYDSYSLLEAPERFEAGIQNYSGQIASGAAVEYLQQIGMDRISAHEEQVESAF